MAYGSLREPGYAERLAEKRAENDARAKEAQDHVAALLRGAKASEAVQPLQLRAVQALERIADALDRAYPRQPGP